MGLQASTSAVAGSAASDCRHTDAAPPLPHSQVVSARPSDDDQGSGDGNGSGSDGGGDGDGASGGGGGTGACDVPTNIRRQM